MSIFSSISTRLLELISLSCIITIMGDSVRVTHPVTVDILLNIFQHFDFSNQLHICMHALFLVAFFSFLRISNLVPYASADCHADNAYFLKRQDVYFTASGAVLRVYRTKTIQFKQRVLDIPLPFIPNSILCPVTAIKKYFCTVPALDSSPLFISITAGRLNLFSPHILIGFSNHALPQ